MPKAGVYDRAKAKPNSGMFKKGHNNGWLGRHHSEATKTKISEKGKGKIPWNKNIPRSEVTKQKLREANTLERIKCKIKGCDEEATITKGICPKHLFREYVKKYRGKHPEKIKEYWQKNKLRIAKSRMKNKDSLNKKCKEWRYSLKLEVFEHYSKDGIECQECGFKDIRALCLDHINGDGAEHRRKVGNSYKVYMDLKRKGYPSGYQVLCSNCNRIKEYKDKE